VWRLLLDPSSCVNLEIARLCPTNLSFELREGLPFRLANKMFRRSGRVVTPPAPPCLTRLSKLEKGGTFVGLEIMGKLAKVLDVEAAEFLKPPPRGYRKGSFS
jgi:hypothetical protein